MVVSSSSVPLILFSLLCTCCQHHAALLSSNSTPGHSVAAVRARRDVTNTTVTFDHASPAPPLLWSKATTTWPAKDGVSWSEQPSKIEYKGDIGVAGDHFSIHDHDASSRSSGGDNYTYHHVDVEGSAATAATSSSNGSATHPHRHLQEQQGVPRRRAKSWRTADGRKSLCSYHRTASMLHGRVDCSVVVVVVVAGSALLVLLCTVAGTALLLLLLRCVHNRNRRGEISGSAADDDPEEHDKDRPALPPELVRRAVGPQPYSYRKLAEAAGNFVESRRIGRGGSGSVYRGYLAEQDRHVAVKMFSAAAGSSGEQAGRREFDAEVRVMSQLRHRNVVQLVGWCDDDDGRNKGLLLAYELAPGGSLDKILHDPDERRFATWPERYRIALDLGAAVLYLHTECEQVVVHGDIKPANVMLDASRGAKLGDFGLARLVDRGGAEPETTQVVAGTFGYVDPEFVGDRKRCPESDVYSFGVVLLEIACGEWPAKKGLRDRVRDMYDRDAVLDAADRRLAGAFDERQMERVLVTGLWCAHRDRSRRPSIAEAVAVLRSERSELPVLPAAAAPHGGLGQVLFALEQRACYGELSTEDGHESTPSSASTAYLSPEDSSELRVEA